MKTWNDELKKNKMYINAEKNQNDGNNEEQVPFKAEFQDKDTQKICTQLSIFLERFVFSMEIVVW